MLGHYLSAALRGFRRSPLSTSLKLLALALGFACFLCAYVFSDFLARADTGWANAGRIYTVAQFMNGPGGGAAQEMTGVAAPLAAGLRLDAPSAQAVGRISSRMPAQTTIGGVAHDLVVRGADPEILEIFDLTFMAGGGDALSRPGAAILTRRAATRLFGGPDAALGQSLHLEMNRETDVTVAAVIEDIAPPSVLSTPFGEFDALLGMDAFDDLAMPVLNVPDAPDAERQAMLDEFARAMRPSTADDWTRPFSDTFVLLPRGARSEALEAGLDAVARRVPEAIGTARFEARPLAADLAREVDRWIMRGQTVSLSVRGLLYGFGVLILAVACLNFANLTTAQTAARSREVALRKTLGAGRLQIAVQALVETSLLALAALGLMLVIVGFGLGLSANAVRLGLTVPSLDRPGFWLGLLGVAGGVALLSGLYPALVLAGVRPMSAQRAGGARGGALRGALTGLQFAIASVLLTGVFIVLAQNAHLRRTGLGQMQDQIVLVSTVNQRSLSSNMLPPNDLVRAELAAHPAIVSVTAAGAGLYAPAFSNQSEVRAVPQVPAQPYTERSVHYDYFRTLGAPLLYGREFAEADGTKAILDAATARNLGLDPAQAIGQPIYTSRVITSFQDGVATVERHEVEWEVIGIVAEPPFELRPGDSGNFVYTPLQFPTLPIVRVSADNVAGGVAAVLAALQRLAPELTFQTRFLDEQFDRVFAMFNRITMGLLGLCLMAVAIAAMGLFGMAGFAVQRRLREVGVRKTLGAGSSRVLAMLIWDFSKPVLLANLAAWPVAWIAAQAYLNLFVTRIGLSPWPFLAALAAGLGVAWAAVGVHAVRAARVKPALVLKAE